MNPCTGQPVHFYIGEDHHWVVWKFHTGETMSYGEFVFDTPGTYPVQASVMTDCGLDTVTQWITVSNTAVPEVMINFTSDYVCPNDEFWLSANHGYQHEWFVDGVPIINIDGEIITSENLIWAFPDYGDYTVKLTNTNQCGISASDSIVIHVDSTSYANAYFNYWWEEGHGYCPNTPIIFETHSSGTFEWDFGDGSTGYGLKVSNTYFEPGMYPVTLYATNGCGYQDTVTDYVNIALDPFSYIPYVDFSFDIEGDNQEGPMDTITICTYEEVRFDNWTGGEDGVEYIWMVEGSTYYEEEISHIFTTNGTHDVTLIGYTDCGASDSATKVVIVDPALMPNANLMAIPKELCPGEEVFFFDDGGQNTTDDSEFLVSYSIDYGDGSPVETNITAFGDTSMQILRRHVYATVGTYYYTFTATNACGNVLTVEDSIVVADDANKIPFYYIGNSAEESGGYNEMQDWSTIPGRPYHTFEIPVDLFEWEYCSTMDSTLYIFFWYDGLDPETNDEPPNGIVEVKAPGNAIAYIPYDVVYPSVGFAAVWYCNPGYINDQPNLWTMPIDPILLTPIYSYDIEIGGYTLLDQTLTLNGMDWDCLCDAPINKVQGQWNYQNNEGYYTILNIWEEEGATIPLKAGETLRYSLGYGPNMYGDHTETTYGTITMSGDSSLMFYGEDTTCTQTTVIYNYTIVDNELTFTLVIDGCLQREEMLLGNIFTREDHDYNDYDEDRTGCPGDIIEFNILGGVSYEWHIDGNIFTEPMVLYSYADTGMYEEFVVATNACGRIDTLFTWVKIDTTAIPDVGWWIENWNPKRFEEIQFMYDRRDSYNYSYLWDFGDGTTSVEKNPVHFYTVEGMYEVTLTITNGCGSGSRTETIWISGATTTCEAKFIYENVDDTIFFDNRSLGNPTNVFWEFGDGTVSVNPNPVHVYPAEGVYDVLLSIYDSIDDCSDQLYKQVMVGSIGCFADFNYTINAVTNTVIFNNLSTGDISELYWDFGDGSFSVDENPTHTYTYPGYYWICLFTWDDATGCYSEKCKEIAVGDFGIHADFGYYIDSETGIVDFTDISEGTVTHWWWEFGDGGYDTVPETSHQYIESGEYTVCLSVYDMYTDAFDDICKEIIVITDTTDVITQARFKQIIDHTTREVEFIDNSLGDITDWYWTFGDGTYDTGDTVIHTYPAPGFYDVCLTVFNGSTGERSELCKTIQVGILTCNVNANFGYMVDPSIKEVTFNDQSTGSANSWFWDFGDGTVSAKRNPKHIYTDPGFYLVSLAVRDTINDCTDYFADFIQVGESECAADFNFTVTDATTNTVKFTNKSVGTIGEYFWYFDDGKFSTEQNPEHTYDNPGLYFVSLTIISSDGLCFDFRFKEVQVGTVDCDASFTVYIDSTTNDAYFTNSNVGSATDYYWLFGDGQYYIGTNPVHHYIAPGYFNVSLNTYNAGNGCMDYSEKVVLIGNSDSDVEANFFYQADFSTHEVSFFNESLGENLTFIWDFGDGTTSTAEDTTHTYAEGGYHFVCLTATNSSIGAIKTTCKLVQTSDDSESCLAQFNADIDTATLDVTFVDKSFGDPDIYAWNFGDGNTSTSSDPVHHYTQADFYLVELFTFNSTTECESYEYKYINVGVDNDSIQAIFTYQFDTTTTKFGSKGKPADIWGQSHGGGSSLSWDYGDGKAKSGKVTATTLRPTHVYENPGIYNCCLTIEDPIIGQSDTYCEDIEVPYETLASESICEGDSYSFFGNDLTTAGVYTDTTTSVLGVDSIVQLTLTVNAVPDKPTISQSTNTLTSSAADGYQWYKDGAAISSATNQTYVVTASGDYHVVVSNSFGCNSVPSDVVSVIPSGIDPISKFDIRIFPNPMQDYTRIMYNLTNTAQVNIKVFDVSGNQVANLVNTYKPAGDHELIWRNTGLPNGIYYLVIQAGNDYVTNKLIIQK
ncbi:PKD domain-containing protein [Bacteroidota bacterium]